MVKINERSEFYLMIIFIIIFNIDYVGNNMIDLLVNLSKFISSKFTLIVYIYN
jgi:hypothetical protein